MSIQAIYQQLLANLRQGHSAALVSSYAADGSINKQLFSNMDPEDWAKLQQLLSQPQTKSSGPVASLRGQDGSFTLIERYNSKPRLIILGGGHIALALTPMAKACDFEVLVYDDRPAFANHKRFSQADEVICDGFDLLFQRVNVRPTDYIVIVTRGHRHDTACLSGILAGIEPAYTGMIGSRRRVAIVLEQMRKGGFDPERLERLHSPIGLRIGAVTPAEISVSILSEIIGVRRSQGSDDLRSSCDLEVVEAIAEQDAPAEALITIYDSSGSVPIDAGAKLSMTYAGELRGTIGGGCSESDAMQIAREVIKQGGWRDHLVDMSDSAEDDGMGCGGQMQVIIERG